jgi:serine protease inhibitor
MWSCRQLAACVAELAMLATGCGDTQAGSAAAPEPRECGVPRGGVAADAQVDEAAQGMRQFGYDLMGADDVTGNEVISPLSLSVAFAMLREGARGETAQQIDDVLGFPACRSEAYDALLHHLGSLHGSVL